MRIESKAAGSRERREWLVLLASLSIAGIALIGLHFFGVQLCLFHKYTGAPCPLCGSSRTLMLLLRARFADAFRLQPLSSLAILGFGLCALVFSWFLVFYHRVLSLTISSRERRCIFWIAAFLIAANWVYLLIVGVL